MSAGLERRCAPRRREACARPSIARAAPTKPPPCCRRASATSCSSASISSSSSHRSSSISAPARAALTGELKRRYRRATVIALDIAPGHAARSAPTLRLVPPLRARVRATCAACPFADASVDIVVSNLMLQWCDDLDAAFAEDPPRAQAGRPLRVHHLRPGHAAENCARPGQRSMTTAHVNTFIDMHDIGDALGARRPHRAGARRGARDAHVSGRARADARPEGHRRAQRHAGRPRGLTGRGATASAWKPRTKRRARDGRIPATYEVVYGAAWGSAGRRARFVQSTAKCASRRARSGIAAASSAW